MHIHVYIQQAHAAIHKFMQKYVYILIYKSEVSLLYVPIHVYICTYMYTAHRNA